jgi:hypothetical protein
VVVLPFLTHFADLSSWEYAQKLLQTGLPRLQDMGVGRVRACGVCVRVCCEGRAVHCCCACACACC